MTISEYLKEELKIRNISQSRLAKACGYMPLPTMCTLLNGLIKPTPYLTQKLKGGLKELGFSDQEIDRYVLEQ